MPGYMKTSAALDASPATKTLTDAYASGWASSWISAGGSDLVRLLLTFTTADATTFQLRLLVEDESGTDGFITMRIASGTASVDEVTITPAGASATERYALQVHVPECRRFKVQAKKTGGSGAPTLTMEYVVGVPQ